jgi:hypothetical protein
MNNVLMNACNDICEDDLHLFDIVTRVAGRPMETDFDLPFVLDLTELQPVDRSIVNTMTMSLEQLLFQMHTSQVLPRDVSEVKFVKETCGV